MQSKQTEAFSKQLVRLPKAVQEQFSKQKELLHADQRHPSLHFKKLKGHTDVYSIRIAGKYRALFILTPDTYIFFAIGHRKNVYR